LSTFKLYTHEVFKSIDYAHMQRKTPCDIQIHPLND
jgi:hypothetical protein